MPDLAHEVLNFSTAADAKAIALECLTTYTAIGTNKKMCNERNIARKGRQLRTIPGVFTKECKQTFSEVRGDIFWSSGLSSLLAESTKPTYFLGRNQLGSVLESIRQDLLREAVLSEQFDINDLLNPDCVTLKYLPVNNVQIITDAQIGFSPSPPSLLSLSNVTEEGSMNNVKVSTPLVSPGTTSMTSLPESSTSQSASISVSSPSSCTNLADCIHVTTENQSKYDGINPKIKHSVKSIKRINSDAKTQGTIIAVFDKCKRKISPNKEADTKRDNLKVFRGDTSPI